MFFRKRMLTAVRVSDSGLVKFRWNRSSTPAEWQNFTALQLPLGWSRQCSYYAIDKRCFWNATGSSSYDFRSQQHHCMEISPDVTRRSLRVETHPKFEPFVSSLLSPMPEFHLDSDLRTGLEFWNSESYVPRFFKTERYKTSWSDIYTSR